MELLLREVTEILRDGLLVPKVGKNRRYFEILRRDLKYSLKGFLAQNLRSICGGKMSQPCVPVCRNLRNTNSVSRVAGWVGKELSLLSGRLPHWRVHFSLVMKG